MGVCQRPKREDTCSLDGDFKNINSFHTCHMYWTPVGGTAVIFTIKALCWIFKMTFHDTYCLSATAQWFFLRGFLPLLEGLKNCFWLWLRLSRKAEVGLDRCCSGAHKHGFVFSFCPSSAPDEVPIWDVLIRGGSMPPPPVISVVTQVFTRTILIGQWVDPGISIIFY